MIRLALVLVLMLGCAPERPATSASIAPPVMACTYCQRQDQVHDDLCEDCWQHTVPPMAVE